MSFVVQVERKLVSVCSSWHQWRAKLDSRLEFLGKCFQICVGVAKLLGAVFCFALALATTTTASAANEPPASSSNDLSWWKYCQLLFVQSWMVGPSRAESTATTTARPPGTAATLASDPREPQACSSCEVQPGLEGPSAMQIVCLLLCCLLVCGPQSRGWPGGPSGKAQQQSRPHCALAALSSGAGGREIVPPRFTV